LLELDESAHAASSSSSSSGSNAMLSQASSRPVAAGRTSSSPGAATEALPPRALLLPKPVSVLEPDTNPLSNYQLVGPPRSVALGEAWAHQVLDVASGACLLALANGEKPPPGCV
jgi:hypothetical protein